MSDKSIGKLAYMIPRGHFRFATSVLRFFKPLNILCAGCPTGEIVIYSFDPQSSSLSPKLLLVPDPRQQSGAVKDLVLATSAYGELTVAFGLL